MMTKLNEQKIGRVPKKFDINKYVDTDWDINKTSRQMNIAN